MSGTDTVARATLAVLSREIPIRIINGSPSGCLFECSGVLDVGTIASLRISIDGRELVDDVRIVRCQAIMGAGSSCQVGAEFLWTAAPHALSLRAGFSW